MTTITLKYEWDMGHRLPLHEGKCQRLHGHRYVAEIDVTGELQTEGPATGMVVDFDDVKVAVNRMVGGWDHRTMMYEHDEILVRMRREFSVIELYETGVFSVPFTPTAENIAGEILKRLRSGDHGQGGRGLNVTRVRVYETPNGWAEVRVYETPNGCAEVRLVDLQWDRILW